MVEIFLVFVVFGGLGLLLILMNRLLGPSRPNPTKDKPFECGSPYLREEINRFPIKFYLIAFIFLLFDIEVVFFFPWAVVFREMMASALIIMAAYIFVLVIGFVYAWKKGAFEWE